ncbi:MAG: hypothetical protein ACLRZ7_12490 [Lachnospiraceae bacterium]
MKKRKRFVIGILCMTIVVSSLTGCSKKIAAAAILLKSAHAMKEINSVTGNLNVVLNYVGENNVNIGVEANTTLQSTVNPFTSYVEGDVDVSIGGINIGIPLKNYIIQENNLAVFYTQLYGIWLRNEISTGTEMDFSMKKLLAFLTDNRVKMEVVDGENTEEKQYYDVRLEIPGAIRKEFIPFTSTQMDQSKLGARFRLLIDRESKRLMQITIDLTQSGGYLLEQLKIPNQQVSKCCFTISFDSFNDVDPMSVSDPIKEKAIDKFEIDKLKSIFSFWK